MNAVKCKVEEGGAYEIENLLVGFNEGPFKLTSHKYKIGMMHNTRWMKIANNSSIPFNSFDFVSLSSVLGSSIEDKIVGTSYLYHMNLLYISFEFGIVAYIPHFADVIGHMVEKDEIKETEKNGRKCKVIDMTLDDLE